MLLLSLSGAAVKICGLFFKIPLFSVIGAEGMGYFSSAYVLYTFFFVLSGSGLPVGVSILVSSAGVYNEKRKHLTAAILSFGSFGLLLGAFMFFFARFAAQAVGNPGAAPSISMMGLTLIFVCLSGAMRGYFQGEKEMLPTAVSQMLEALGKTALGVLFAYSAVKRGASAEKASAAALFGIALASALSVLYLAAAYLVKSKGKVFSSGALPKFYHFKRLFAVTLPVSAASMVMSLTSIIDLSMMMRRLQDAGNTALEANRLYGLYSGLAVPIFNLPAVFVTPVAVAVVPYISSAVRQNDLHEVRRLSETALKLALLLSLPCAAGLAALSHPILQLLYGASAAEGAAPMLIMLSPSVVFVALQTVSAALLQGTGKRTVPMLTVLAGSCVKLVAGWFLIGRYGVVGAPVGTLLCCLVSAALDLILFGKSVRIGFPLLKGALIPAFAAACCGGAARSIYRVLTEAPLQTLSKIMRLGRCAPALFLSIVAGGAVYLLLVFLFGCLDAQTLQMMPGGKISGKILFLEKRRQRSRRRV